MKLINSAFGFRSWWGKKEYITDESRYPFFKNADNNGGLILGTRVFLHPSLKPDLPGSGYLECGASIDRKYSRDASDRALQWLKDLTPICAWEGKSIDPHYALCTKPEFGLFTPFCRDRLIEMFSNQNETVVLWSL